MSAARNLPAITWASDTGEVSSTSIVPERRSSATSRIVITGTTKSMKSQKNTVPPKNSRSGVVAWVIGLLRKDTMM